MEFKIVRELVALSKDIPKNFGTTIQNSVNDEGLYEICFLVPEDVAREIISVVGQVGRRLRSVGA